MTRMLLDCDPGIDDAMAIIFALKSDRVEVEGITPVSGNVDARARVTMRACLEDFS